MKIVVDGRLIADRETGISNYTKKIVEIYIKWVGYDNVTVILNNLSVSIDAKTIYTEYRPFNILHFFLYSRFLQDINFDLYHSPFYSNFYFPIKNKAVVITVHDLMYRFVNGFFGYNVILDFLARSYYNFIVGRSIRNANLIIVDSKITSADVWRIYRRKSVVVPLWVRELPSPCEVNGLPQEIKKKKFILYVGNERPHKNLNFLIYAFKRSYIQKDFVLVLAGGKKGWKEGNVIQLGYVAPCELRWLYENGYAFVLPSLYEGFGLPVVEAMKYMNLIILSNCGALKEFKYEGVYFFNPSDEKELIFLFDNIESLKKVSFSDVTEEYAKEKFETRHKKVIMDFIKNWNN